MLNIIWPIFIIISVIYSLFSGNISEVNDSIFKSIESTMSLILTMVGNICFWSGIMNILEKTNFFKKLKNMVTGAINLIFKNLEKDSKESEYISLNILSNLLGLGNASTPMGIKAMNEMDNKNGNKKVLSKNMMLFILINTASLQIIPTGVIAIRSSLGSKYPSKMIIHVWITTVIVFLFVLVFGKLFFKEEEK